MPTQQLTHTQIAELYDAYGSRVKAYCERVLGCPAAAEDATQETFLNLLRRAPDIVDQPDARRTYLFATARNACYDQVRRRRPTTSLQLITENGDPEAEPATVGPSYDPVRQALTSELRSELVVALARLPSQQAAAVVLRDAVDLSYDQIAERLATNSNNVAQLLHRARKTLANSLRPASGLVPPGVQGDLPA